MTREALITFNDHLEKKNKELKEALFDVLDSLGALTNPSELSGWNIDEETAKRYIELAKGE